MIQNKVPNVKKVIYLASVSVSKYLNKFGHLHELQEDQRCGNIKGGEEDKSIMQL